MAIILLVLLIGLIYFFLIYVIRNQDTSISNPSPSELENSSESKDSFEGWFIGGARNPKPIKAHLEIKYKDSYGSVTEREIYVQEFDDTDNPQGLIMCRCLLRNATRTFRYDRIKECLDMDTGEIIDDLRPYLQELYQSSPDYSLRKFFEANTPSLECLVYIAKSDGRFVKAEREKILRYCRKYMTDNRVDDTALEKALKGTRTISVSAYRRIVGRLAKLPLEARNEIVLTAQDILNIKKVVHPAEQEAFDYLRKRVLVV